MPDCMQVRTGRSCSNGSGSRLDPMTTDELTTEMSPPAPAAPDFPALPDSPDSLDDRALLIELEPEVHRLYDRHAGMAQEWFPHDFIPYRLGRDFDKEPWTPDQPRLTGVAQ